MAYCRRLRTALLGLSAALWANPGLAQTDTSTNVSTSTTTTALALSDFTLSLQRQDGDSWVNLATTDAAIFLNQARCQCATPVRVVVLMTSASRSKLATLTATGTNARLYVGNNCAQLNTAAIPNRPQCDTSQLGSTLSGLSSLSANGSWSVDTTVDKLFAAVGNCGGTLSTTIWLWIDSTGSGYPDSGISGGSAPHLGIQLDGTPPPAPVGVAVNGGQEALMVSWAPVSAADWPDLAGYLVFCTRGDDLQVFNPSYYSNQYYTSQTMCSGSVAPLSAPTTVTSAAGQSSAVEVGAPTALRNLDSAFLCSGRLSPSQTSVRLGILQDGIPYTVGVAAVDNNGNASPITSGFVQIPVPTINFYEAYRDAGGHATGGYCSLAGRGARLGAISLLASTGLAALIVLRRRRRTRRALSRSLPFLLLALSINPAQAQVVTHAAAETSVDPSKAYETPKEWAIELRFGPYRPNVDSEFSGSPGVTPYKTMFGGKRHLMSQLEVDWQFFQNFGTLAVGVAVGYSTVSSKAFIADATGACVRDANDACVRSGDTTSLRLIPIAALLVYRWDVAAEDWKIPLVPYGKLGLNYTFWDITDGNGNVPHAGGGHGSGGTAGWQAAVGISLLLDFLDPDAARGLDMETNINHSYVFFEWNRVDATGLGMSNKLHVGDSRWVIGLMFEF
jgi:hypothetical protein